MDVQLRVVVARVVLEERRDRPVVRVDPAAGGAAVVADPGVAGLLGEVVQGGVVAGPDGVLDRPPMLGPRRLRGLGLGHLAGVLPHCTGVAGLHCTGQCVAGAGGCTGRLHLLGFEGGVEHRDRLLHRERRVEERDVLPGLLAGLEPQLGPPLRICTGLGGQCGRVQLLLGQVPAAGVTEGRGLVPPGRVAERRVARVEEPLVEGGHVLGVDLAGQPQEGRSAAVPAAGRLPRRHGAGVVVLPPCGHRLGQIGRAVAARDGQHEPATRLPAAPLPRNARRAPSDRDA